MKKLAIGITAVVLLASVGFNVKQNNDLSYLETLNDTTQKELINSEEARQDLEDDKTALIQELGQANDNVAKAQEEVQIAAEELAEANEILASIDDLLEGNGVTIVKVEELISENDKLQRQIAKLTTEVEEYKALALGETIEEEPVDEVVVEPTPVIDVPTSEWSASVQDVIDFINKRIGELQAASDTLPTLSLERIMINQEVEVLDEAIVDLEKLKTSIDNF